MQRQERRTRWHRRGAGGLALLLVATLPVIAGSSPRDSLVKPLLPTPKAGTACFAGTFAGRTVRVEDWGNTRRVETDVLLPDGKRATRNEPAQLGEVETTSVLLRLDYDTRRSNYDWIYNFRLGADLKSIGSVRAAGECPWYDRDSVHDGVPQTGNTHSLYCGIDCDGGSMGVRRAPGEGALLLSFGELGLAMRLNCGGRGRPFRVFTSGTPAGGELRLEPVAAKRCAGLKAE